MHEDANPAAAIAEPGSSPLPDFEYASALRPIPRRDWLRGAASSEGGA